MFVFDKEQSLTIQRSPDNGGDKTYTTVEELKADHASEDLHPGDLKAAVTTVTVNVLDGISKALAADKDLKQAVKTLKNYQKKVSKS